MIFHAKSSRRHFIKLMAGGVFGCCSAAQSSLIARGLTPSLNPLDQHSSGAGGSAAAAIRFTRFRGSPTIPRTPGTFYSRYSANPEVLFFKGRYLLYFRGQAEDGHDQVGVGWADPQNFDGVHWQMAAENPIIRVSPRQSDHDSAHVLDPATVVLNGEIYLYYTAHSADKSRVSSTGLAKSRDGIRFEKAAQPVTEGYAPEAVLYKGQVHLFHQRRAPDGSFQIHLATSRDGTRFNADAPVVFGPSRQAGAFDRFSISTVRAWRENGWFYMTYGGCDKYADYPVAIGLARSRDLYRWERYPHNPILTRGEPGAWDEGALWFATVMKVRDVYYLWYEGCGTGTGLRTAEDREASRRSREADYGGYGQTSFSQIGLATYHGGAFRW